jgi:hypothetical protein
MVSVFVDGVPVGSPGSWASRSDLNTLFAGYGGLATALGVLQFSSASYANGVHTISWLVTDNQGAAAGIGSRYFTVSNGSGLTAASTEAAATAALSRLEDLDVVALDSSAIAGRRGYDLTVPFRALRVENGRQTLHGEELDRFELVFPDPVSSASRRKTAGYLRTSTGLMPLPIGSHLDPETGVFTWQPGVAFIGAYDLVFVRCEGSPKGLRYEFVNPTSVAQGFSPANAAVNDTSVAQGFSPARSAVNDTSVAQGFSPARSVATDTSVAQGFSPACTRSEIRIILHPKASGRVGPQVVIDLPSSHRTFAAGERIVLAGWAIDRDTDIGTGVDTLHVWAYPATGEPPWWVGVAAYGGERPDVGAIFGDQFTESGYGIRVRGLEPGTYDLAVFAWSTVQNRFVPAKTVRITAR